MKIFINKIKYPPNLNQIMIQFLDPNKRLGSG